MEPGRARPAAAPAVDGLRRRTRVVGRDKLGRDVFGFLPGEVGHYPWSPAVATDAALTSAAHLLRRFHDATVPIAGRSRTGWRLPAIEPVEVVCHNDFAPYNCVYDGSRVTGVFDFDFAVPGPRSWDLAHALFRFVPLTDDEAVGAAQDQGRRARLFLDAYGADGGEARAAVDPVVPRLRFMVDFMTAAAAAGDENFARHIAEGDRDRYLRDIEWVTASRLSLHKRR